MKSIESFIAEPSYQIWADYNNLNEITYSFEVTPQNEYFKEYVSYPQIDYWEWFVIPTQIVYNHTPQLTFKPHKVKIHLQKKQPVLSFKKSIVPLRI